MRTKCGLFRAGVLLSSFSCFLVTTRINAYCPTDPGLTPRAGSGPYVQILDRLVTDSGSSSLAQNKSQASSIGGDFTSLSVAYETIDATKNAIFLQRYLWSGNRACACSPLPSTNCDDFFIRLDDPATEGQHRHVSVAMRNLTSASETFPCGYNSVMFACWVATLNEGGTHLPELMQLSKPYASPVANQFHQTNFDSQVGPVAILGLDYNDVAPSAALSCSTDVSDFFWESALSNDLRPTGTRGLIRDPRNPSTITPAIERIRCCDDGCTSDNNDVCTDQLDRHRPCVVHRDDGTQIVVWAEKELPGGTGSPFNIAMRVYKPDGTLAAQRDRESMGVENQSVNEPLREIPLSDQISPAVDVDACGNIIVVWVGRVMHEKGNPSAPCTDDDDIAVFGRRFHYNDAASTSALRPMSGQFRVDTSGTDWKLGSTMETVHPTVAIRHIRKVGDPGGENQAQGGFCVGWNAIRRDGTEQSVRGQFFHPDGSAEAIEFDLSPPADDGISRTLAESNQHTLAWVGFEVGDHGDVFATWTETNGSNSNIWLTKVNRAFVGLWETANGTCLKGDVDLDGTPDGNDADELAAALIDGLDCSPYTLAHCAADVNGDGLLNGRDIQCFVYVVTGLPNSCAALTAAVICGNSSFEPFEPPDCNENGVDDIEDIIRGTSLDCNKDGVPDECQLADNDCDGNDVPDDCQLRMEDCNYNGIVDSCDIAAETSDDCDSNGVPDECQPDCNGNNVADVCDIASEDSTDCDENGVPDECQEDCNGNDVADECDIANSTSQDCNENGVPDECDLSRSLLPSLDCNDNDIPDECELSGNDKNENGIPDDCEESMRGGGESMMSGGEGGEFDEQAAWELFFEWYDQEVLGEGSDWGTLSGSERFHLIMDEIQLLGLPYAAPW